MNVGFPFHFDTRGRTAESDDDAHIRELIELVLLTAPGERVNRPDFGSGLARLVHAPNSQELAAATQFLVQSSLQHHLADLIQVEEVEVQGADAELRVTVTYTVRRTQAQRVANLALGAGP